jgi:hypothetical protein
MARRVSADRYMGRALGPRSFHPPERRVVTPGKTLTRVDAQTKAARAGVAPIRGYRPDSVCLGADCGDLGGQAGPAGHAADLGFRLYLVCPEGCAGCRSGTLPPDRRALQCQSVIKTNGKALRHPDMMSRALTAQGVDGQAGALALRVRRLMGQAAVVSFIDVFVITTVLFASLAVAALLMKALPKDLKVNAH